MVDLGRLKGAFYLAKWYLKAGRDNSSQIFERWKDQRGGGYFAYLLEVMERNIEGKFQTESVEFPDSKNWSRKDWKLQPQRSS